MALLIDSDLLIDLGRRSDTADLDRVLSGEKFAISVITVSELLHGVMRATGARRTKRRAFVEYILAGLHAIPITPPVARIHADIWPALAEGGNVIGGHDLWIAATALAHGMGVATRDADDFGRVPGLRVVTP